MADANPAARLEVDTGKAGYLRFPSMSLVTQQRNFPEGSHALKAGHKEAEKQPSSL